MRSVAGSKRVMVARLTLTLQFINILMGWSAMHRKMKLPDESFEARTKPVVADFICKTHPLTPHPHLLRQIITGFRILGTGTRFRFSRMRNLPKFIFSVIWNRVPQSQEPGAGFRFQESKTRCRFRAQEPGAQCEFSFPGTRETIVICLNMKEKIYRNTPSCSKTLRNELSSEFPFLTNGTPRNGNPDTSTYEVWSMFLGELAQILLESAASFAYVKSCHHPYYLILTNPVFDAV